MRIDGPLWHQHAGTFVTGAGDVNGDGLSDVLVGTAEVHRVGPRLRGPAWNLYVVFGRRGARGRVVRLDRLGGGGLHLVRHEGGFSAGAGAGDVNGDGLADIVLGSAIENTRASAYVVYGRRRGGSVDVDRLGRGGFVVRTGANIESGPAVAGAGDLDRDGLADIVVGDPEYVPPGGEFGTGRAVVVFGRHGSAPVDLRHLGRSATTILGPGPLRLSTPAGERLFGVGFGDAVAGVADLNGDGHRDVVVGAPFLDGREGGAFVVTQARRRGVTIDTRAPEDGWYRIAGAGGNATGWSLASAGDQNGDGLNDLLIGGFPGGALLASSSGPSSAYVVYGSRAPHDVALATLGAAGVVL
ncbi:MAG: VCBS repeat-containing protein [Solirubrobacteraceae bacterium]